MPAKHSDVRQTLLELPKVDLHRHLEGSLRLETMLELIQREGLDLPNGDMNLQRLVQVQPDDPRTSSNFLAKFASIRKFFRTPDIIRRITYEAITDAATDHVIYLELHFTPVALAETGSFPLAEVVDYVIEAAILATAQFSIRLGLIASINRHEEVELAEQVAQIAVDRQNQGVVGLSLAGDEAGFSAGPFMSLLSEAQQAGLGITIHAGEWAGAENILHALEDLETTRIGHGVRVMEDPEIVSLARDRQTVFEVCLTSNIQSGVVSSLSDHPLRRMIQAGLHVTINTDNPKICNTLLSHECALAIEEQQLSVVSIKQLILSAAQAGFLPRQDKAVLESELLAAFLPIA
jgi:adenosine deaminase